MKRFLAPIMLAAGLLAGCVSAPPQVIQPAQVDFAAPPQPAAWAAQNAATATPTGSLFHAPTYRVGFEDRRARQVGDTVTIRIVENVTASQRSSTTSNRNSSVSGSVSAIPGLSLLSGSAGRTANKVQGSLAIGAENQSDFTGSGDTESANAFSGSITATVVDVLPNGHLMLMGEKQIGLNHNVDVLRFTGTVDPLAIQPGSLVASTQVANVRVESRSRGPQHEVQTVGWLTRFFHTISPF